MLKAPGTGSAVLQGTGGSIKQGYTDISGTPGSGTANTPRGRFAFTSASTSATITCNVCAATSAVLLSLQTGDATATSVTVVPGAGSFVVTTNAATTGTPKCDFLVVN